MHTTLEQIDKDRLPQMLQRQTSDKDIPGTKILIMNFKFPGRSDNHFKIRIHSLILSTFKTQLDQTIQQLTETHAADLGGLRQQACGGHPRNGIGL